jgi:peptidoglycan/LPS O-acetylase OafA/YrhL
MAGLRPNPGAAGGRFPEVDGLRAIAVSLVLADHFLSHAIPIGWVRHLSAFGWVGVDLFFVISGFLIGGILLDHREAANYYRVFYTRRFFRIFPLYLLLIAPAFLVVGLGWQHRFAGHSLGEVNLGGMMLFLCFMQNLGGGLLFLTPNYLGVMWSLAVEEQFYLLLPPLVRKLKVTTLLKWMGIAIVAAPLIRGALFLFLPNHAAWAGMASYKLLPCRWDSLLLGVVSAYAWREPAWRQWLASRVSQLRAAWWVLGVGVAGMALAGLGETSLVLSIPGYTWIAAFFTATLLVARVNPGGWLYRVLSLDLLRPIATVSYALYLLQGPMLVVKEALVRRTSWPEVSWTVTGANLVALAATALVAAISWKYFEGPLLRIGHRTAYRHESVSAALRGSEHPAGRDAHLPAAGIPVPPP